MRPHTIHEENCKNVVRCVVKVNNKTITLMGKYGFSWQIAIESEGRIVINEYPNRIEANKDFKKYKRVK